MHANTLLLPCSCQDKSPVFTGKYHVYLSHITTALATKYDMNMSRIKDPVTRKQEKNASAPRNPPKQSSRRARSQADSAGWWTYWPMYGDEHHPLRRAVFLSHASQRTRNITYDRYTEQTVPVGKDHERGEREGGSEEGQTHLISRQAHDLQPGVHGLRRWLAPEGPCNPPPRSVLLHIFCSFSTNSSLGAPCASLQPCVFSSFLANPYF